MDSANEKVVDEQEKSKSAISPISAMSQDEVEKHTLLCLKLSAENKINVKNAFDLHLIEIMKRKVLNNEQDLQSASLSLQASSKIYASRVDALYKETFALHNQLQTITSNKKGMKNLAKDNELDEAETNEGQDETSRKERRRTSKPKKTYLTNEANVTLKNEANPINTFPHASFITIKSAFNASRTSPSLLEALPPQNDSCKIYSSIPVHHFRQQEPMPANDFLCPAKIKHLIRKVQNIKTCSADPESTISDVFYSAEPRTPPPDFDLPSDDSFCIGTTPVQEKKDEDVQEITEKFSILDITADVLVKDLSLALVNRNTIDRSLLPPNSALKRILDTADKTKPKKTPAKPRKEKPPRKPFFGRRTVDKSLLKKGYKITLNNNDISKWQLSTTTLMHCGGHDKFSKELDDQDSKDKENILRTTNKLIQESAFHNYLDNYFLKHIQPWKHFQHHATSPLVRPSSFGICLNDNNSREMGESENSNLIVQSFQNLSLHNSPVGSDDFCLDGADDSIGGFSPGISLINPLSKSSCFEVDLKYVLVTPPELVKPLNVKFQTEPITLSTEKVKGALWNIIEKNDTIMLSDLHKRLKLVFEGEKLPLQYVFTMLLLLSNEKCLLLETISNGVDVKVSKDILEEY